MENRGCAKGTLQSASQMLTALSRQANLNVPQQVEQAIARQQVSNSRKRNLAVAYSQYAKYYKIEWTMPKYKKDTKHFKVPTTEKLHLLIAAATPALALKLRISMETGLRPVELMNLPPNDIDTDRKTVTPRTAKNGAPRTLPIQETLCEAIKAHIRLKNVQPTQRLFPAEIHSYGNNYQQTRNKLAKKLNDPTLLKIRLYDFRHYFGTKTMQKTQSVPFAAYCMGHKDWKNTQVYVDILAILNSIDEEYNTAVARTLEEATKLIQQGFQYVTDFDNAKIFRKRK